MNKFPEHFNPNEIVQFDEYYINYVTNICREDIYKFFIKNTDVTKEFYDFNKIFKNKNLDQKIQNNIMDNIISELKMNWKVALIFGKTGMIISETEEKLKQSIWSSNLDFEIV